MEMKLLPKLPSQTWIGLSDRSSAWKGVMRGYENSWRWSTTGAVNPGGYQNWVSGEPNNKNAIQLCVVMQQGQWQDRVCGATLPFICFTELPQVGSKQYTYVSTSMTWAAAKDHCRLYYTDLAMILDSSENSAAASVISSNSIVAWIGLYRVPWVWVDGQSCSFFNWRSPEPDNGEGCVTIDGDLKWRDEDCMFTNPFLCHQAETRSPETKTILRPQSPEIKTFSRQQSPEIKTFSRQQSPEIKTFSRQQSPEIKTFSRPQSPEIKTFSRPQSPEIKTFSRQQSPEIKTFSRQQSPEI
ncbi:hypothetical protein WMY93_015207 [Mugilogobius chulae]|uniref:C-type lectin domain-containing protein n=1 Tax=Mugilogobius chulae TaxID=88201 RepID=A0AAW0P1G6_9GOBI